ncbi:MAG: cytochrome d ubiquinol oxidase subunit II [Acidobacteriales bacterium]|nr:cytochrome d ubiquinol oxidase subunit II [Terriglobales bacterium]
METVWFIIVAVMVAAYVILDGFDLGAGVVLFGVARTSTERQAVIRAVGPVWDGNEVWLLAAGGTLYFAFPALYASSFSGFYLPLMMVLWLLMLRAIGIEFRSHIEDRVWQPFFEGVFCISSALLAIFFGAALGNVVRGVPLAADGYFFEPLWTNFRVGPSPGILDWYTVLTGVVALVTLTVHGSLYLTVKTEGDLQHRARRMALLVWPAEVVVTVLSLLATRAIRPEVMHNYQRYPIGLLVPIAVGIALGVIPWATLRGKEKFAFLASCLYIAAMLVGAAFALYPTVLPASSNADYSLTIYNTAAGMHGLSVGLWWWSLGAILATGYFVFLYRMFAGKVKLEEGVGH